MDDYGKIPLLQKNLRIFADDNSSNKDNRNN